MFGSLIARGFPAKNGNLAVGKEEEQEESKELPPTDTINMQAPGGVRQHDQSATLQTPSYPREARRQEDPTIQTPGGVVKENNSNSTPQYLNSDYKRRS